MLLVMLVVFIAVGASTFLAVQTESKVLRKSMTHRGKHLTENIAASTKSAFWSLNWVFVETMLQEASASAPDELVFAKVVKPNGEIYLADKKSYYGEQESTQLLSDTPVIKNPHHFDAEADHGMLFVQPVEIGKETWYILIGLSTKTIEAALTNLIWRNVQWGCFILIATVMLSYLFAKSITKPLISLATAAKSISDGQREQLISLSAKDEIGLLSHSFNKMIRSMESAEKALKASNERLEMVLDSIDATIFVADLKSHEILFMNRHMRETFDPDMENGAFSRLLGQDPDEPDEFGKDRLVDAHGKPQHVSVWEARHPTTQRWYVNYERVIRWTDDRPARIQISTDITKIKELEWQRLETEAKLRRSQKMEVIGMLAGGVAHDLNNILSGIVSYPEVLMLDLPKDSPLCKPIEKIQEAGQRAATIVSDLLTLARRGVPETKVLNLNRIVEQFLLSPEFRELETTHAKVKLMARLDEDIMAMEGSPIHLSKTVMNLIFNAAEAMPKGGDLTVSTENVYVDQPFGGYDTIAEGDYVRLQVTDTGVGISKEDMEKVFEPFYTKKVMGHSGTGLGMAVVWGAVNDHKGYIDIQSSEGKGTTFSIYFPASRQLPREDEVKPNLSTFSGHGEHLLLVDDIPEQREIGAIMLQRLGYQVTTLASGEEAVAHVRKNRVDALVLDMIMPPGIDGLETYRRILKIYPHQKAILASGFSETERVREAQRLGAGAYIKKPYTMEEIGRALQELLDQPDNARQQLRTG